MKKLGSFRRNKRGISSIFIGLYIAMLIILLSSTLFIALSISDKSLTSYLRTEQNRAQETILITGPDGLKINLLTNKYESIRVNNTGAMPVRIRAIYIDGKFVCDPSSFSGDSYIAPQDSIVIDLSNVNPAITLLNNPLDSRWTVTTERGTSSSDIGSNLWLGPPGFSDPSELNFGPLQLIFPMFHWSNDGGVTWHNGWTIPDGTANVIWRILVANIDSENRKIVLNNTSNFALVGNNKQNNKILTWDIDTARTDMLLIPKRYSFIYYYSTQHVTGYTPVPIASNFLTFIGNFIETDNQYTSFGQTIPFEAVLITT